MQVGGNPNNLTIAMCLIFCPANRLRFSCPLDAGSGVCPGHVPSFTEPLGTQGFATVVVSCAFSSRLGIENASGHLHWSLGLQLVEASQHRRASRAAVIILDSSIHTIIIIIIIVTSVTIGGVELTIDHRPDQDDACVCMPC